MESNGTSGVERLINCLGRVLDNMVDQSLTYDAQTEWNLKSCLSHQKKTISEFAEFSNKLIISIIYFIIRKITVPDPVRGRVILQNNFL